MVQLDAQGLADDENGGEGNKAGYGRRDQEPLPLQADLRPVQPDGHPGGCDRESKQGGQIGSGGQVRRTVHYRRGSHHEIDHEKGEQKLHEAEQNHLQGYVMPEDSRHLLLLGNNQ